MNEGPKPEFFEFACRQISEIYKRWEQAAKGNSVHAQPIAVSAQIECVPNKDEQALLDYAGKRISEFYKHWREVNSL